MKKQTKNNATYENEPRDLYKETILMRGAQATAKHLTVQTADSPSDTDLEACIEEKIKTARCDEEAYVLRAELESIVMAEQMKREPEKGISRTECYNVAKAIKGELVLVYIPELDILVKLDYTGGEQLLREDRMDGYNDYIDWECFQNWTEEGPEIVDEDSIDEFPECKDGGIFMFSNKLLEQPFAESMYDVMADLFGYCPKYQIAGDF